MTFTSYPKIECVFKRDLEGNKKLMPGVWRSEELECLADCKWTFTEKVDGTNTQIVWDGHSVSFGGRTERANIPAPLADFLSRTFSGDKNEEIFEQLFGETPVVLFGEGYGPKINGGGGYCDSVRFILFDVKIGGYWLKRANVEEIARAFGIDVVPIILEGTLHDGVRYMMTHPNSQVAQNNSGSGCEMEGLVGTIPCGLLNRKGERVMCKIKWKDLRELLN